MDVESPASPAPYEGEEPAMSEDQQKAMAVLENRQQSGSPSQESSSDDHNPEMSAFALESLKNNSFDPTDTDIEMRINKANQDLAKEPAPAPEREKRIKFKENLIDFEAPPNDDDIDATPRSPQSQETKPDTIASLENDDSGSASKKSGGSLLIEKEGKFELVNESDVQDDGKSKDSGTDEKKEMDIEDLLNLNSTKPAPQEEANEEEEKEETATPEESPTVEKEPVARPGSAPSKTRDAASVQGIRNPTPPRPRSAASTSKLFRGHRSPEMIEEAKKQAEEKRKADIAAKKKQKEESDAKDRENRDAFEAWCKEKEKVVMEERKKHRDRLRKEQEDQENKDIYNDAYGIEKDGDKDAFQEWIKKKNEQERKARKLEKYRKEEETQWTVARSQRECEKAFKRWCRQKRRQELEERSFMISCRASSAVMIRKSRKSAQIAQAIKLAEQFRFIDHYGYRY